MKYKFLKSAARNFGRSFASSLNWRRSWRAYRLRQREM